MDRIPLIKKYELWKNTLSRFFGGYEHLGELEYIKDSQHAQDVLNSMTSLSDELKMGASPIEGDEKTKIFRAFEDLSTSIDKKAAKKSVLPIDA